MPARRCITSLSGRLGYDFLTTLGGIKMKISRFAGPLVPVVGVLCVLLVLPAAPANAQGAELSGAVKAVRQAEDLTNNREVKDSLGEAGKALKRAEKLAAKGQTGPLLEGITAVRRTLAGLLDETDTDSSPAAPSIERAVGLIDDAIRKAGGYRVSTDTSLGLHTTSLASLRGTVRVYLPDDIRVGDTISGTVEVEPAGATPEERQRNGATLSGVVISLEEDETSVSDGSVRWRVPMLDNDTATLVLRDPSGAEVGRTTVPVNPVADELGFHDQPNPTDYDLPPIVQFGNPFAISGPFDGEFVTTALDCGGELTLLAESPRTLIARAPLDLVGQHPMTLSEGGTVVGRDVNVIQLHLSAGKLDLLRGETTVVTAEVTGFAGLEPEAYPIEFEMVNHSPETVTMEGLEDNRYYQLISPEDISTGEDVSTEGSFVVESTLHGIHTGTFNISATVTSPILFDIVGPGEQLTCSEEKRFRLLCVRFIILDEPGAKERKKDPKGLLKGVKYNGKNFGEVSQATVATTKAALEKANAIWLQCFAHCCWIHFDLDTEDGKPAIYALDPKGVQVVVAESTFKLFHAPKYWDVKQTLTCELSQLLDNQNPRDITMNDGNAQITVNQEVTWNEDVGSDFKKGDSAQAAVERAAREADRKDTKESYEQRAQKQFTVPASVVGLLGASIDEELGRKCINIILVNSLDDTGKKGDESGWASRPGRNMILEEKELDSTDGAVLAHELGHNLGLEHVDDADRLMNKGGAGFILTKEDCDTACNTAVTDDDVKPATLSDDEAKERHDALEEARRKAEEERKAEEDEERRKAEEEEKRQKEIEEIDARIGEIDRRTAELEQTIKAKEDKFRESVEKQGLGKSTTKQILDDNLPEQARKEKAELEKLKQEKADLEQKKAGLQE